MTGLALIPVALLGAALLWYLRPAWYRFRMTVEVETPEGVRSGSAVHQVYGRRLLVTLPDSNSDIIEWRGEAVVVEMPGGQKLFVLRRPSRFTDTFVPQIHATLDAHFTGGMADALGSIRRLSRLPHGSVSAPLARPHYPLMMFFRDILDPTSAEEVDPDNLAPAFGEGTFVRQITLTIVKDPVSRGIVRILPWLPQYLSRHLNGDKIHYLQAEDLAAHIGAGSFSSEIRR